MKTLSLIKSLILCMVIQLSSITLWADTSTVLIVSINHTVNKSDVQNHVKALERIDMSMGTCSFNATVTDYIEYEQVLDIDYHGIALVQVDEVCAKNQLSEYINWIYKQQKEGIYTLFSNPNIDPAPVFSGRN